MSYRPFVVAGLGALWLLYLYSGVEIRPVQAQALEVKSPEKASPSPVAATPKISRTPQASFVGAGPALGVATPVRRVTLPEAFCRLQAAGVDVGMANIKLVFLVNEQPTSQEPFLTTFINHKDCPEGTYSRAEISQDHRLLSFLDCREQKKEDLFLAGGLQGEIVPVLAQSRRVNVAISGAGLFMEKCADQIRFSRRGSWTRTEEGLLQKEETGCLALNRQGQALQLLSEDHLDEQGCTSAGECLAVAWPEDEGSFAVVDRTTLAALDEDPFRFLLSEVKLFMNSQEDLNDPFSGILGPQFDRLPVMDKPAWCPESF